MSITCLDSAEAHCSYEGPPRPTIEVEDRQARAIFSLPTCGNDVFLDGTVLVAIKSCAPKPQRTV